MDMIVYVGASSLPSACTSETNTWRYRELMRVSFARRVFAACIPMAGTVATMMAIAAPGAAHAELLLQCEGASILGRGSTIQGGVAQDKVWNPAFNTSGNATACNGTQGIGAGAKPTVEYLQKEE